MDSFEDQVRIIRPGDDPLAWMADGRPTSFVWIVPSDTVARDYRSRTSDPTITIVSRSEVDSQTFPSDVIVLHRGVSISVPDGVTVIRLVGPYDRPGHVAPTSPVTPVVIRHAAAGTLGECRLAARHIRKAIDVGVSPAKIIVAARRPEIVRAMLDESLRDCGVPFSTDLTKPWRFAPGVARLLDAIHMPVAQFPHGMVATLLRSADCQPVGDVRLIELDHLLNQLGRTKGRQAYLDAVDTWAISPPQPLEDESALGTKRRRLEALATRCRPALHAFFQRWDALPASATPADWLDATARLADDLFEPNRHRTEFLTFCRDRLPATSTTWLLTEFDEWLRAQAEERAWVVSESNRESVRLVDAVTAVHLPCDLLIVLDMADGSFPVHTTTDEKAKKERILFHDLLRRASRELVLSYAMVDAAGKKQLPAAFLEEYQAKHPELPPAKRQTILLDRFANEEALSATERRVQAARRLKFDLADPLTGGGFTDDWRNHLVRVYRMNGQRMDAKTFTPFDGMLDQQTAIDKAAERFPPERTISPSSLETYATCPFRFWMDRVLGLEEPETPADDVRADRRGQAIHRAMARYLREGGDGDLAAEFQLATNEYRAQAGSKLGEVLWDLEGRRLARIARNYARQEAKYQSSFESRTPRPAKFEQTFGTSREPGAWPALELGDGETKVRIGGTIDRIDTVTVDGEERFMVVDYKTGLSAGSYTAKGIKTRRALQLPLYTMAAEQNGVTGPARPLGLVYWFLAQKTGATFALPSGKGAEQRWVGDSSEWEAMKAEVERTVVAMMTDIRAGRFPLAPKDDDCTATCPYAQACRIANGRSRRKFQSLGGEYSLESDEPNDTPDD